VTDPQPCPDAEQGDPGMSEFDERPSGEHVVITPQTAGSAGAAHTQES
jgi:hypothetical protein